jgi:uncharacterized protein
MDHQSAIDHILSRLQAELPSHLHYHGHHHTLDVLRAADHIGSQLGITDKEAHLLSVAAAFHDCGFLVTYSGHEAAGCEIARKMLPDFGFSSSDIELITEMIMATRVPQEPKTLLAEILCDADLDYLGREDFYTIGRQLFDEWMHVGIVMDEKTWNRIQVKFLSSHHYHTEYSRKLRTPVKETYLAELELLVASYGQ